MLFSFFLGSGFGLCVSSAVFPLSAFFSPCFLFAFWSESPKRADLPLARGRRRDPMRHSSPSLSLSSFASCLSKGFFTTHAGYEHQSSLIGQPTHTQRETARRPGRRTKGNSFFFFLSFFCALIWFGFGVWRCKGGLCTDANGIGNRGLGLIERVHWSDGMEWEGMGSPGVDRVHYLARREAGRRGEEWVGKERMNGGQSIHICEWAPVYRNREWHFFRDLWTPPSDL